MSSQQFTNAFESFDHFKGYPTRNIAFVDNSELAVISGQLRREVLNKVTKYKEEQLKNENPQEITPHKISQFIMEAIATTEDVKNSLDDCIKQLSTVVRGSFEVLRNDVATEVETLRKDIAEVANARLSTLTNPDSMEFQDTVDLKVVDPVKFISDIDDIDRIASLLHDKFAIKANTIKEVFAVNMLRQMVSYDTNQNTFYDHPTIVAMKEKWHAMQVASDFATPVKGMDFSAAINQMATTNALTYYLGAVDKVGPGNFFYVVEELLGTLSFLSENMNIVSDEPFELLDKIMENGKLLINIALYLIQAIVVDGEYKNCLFLNERGSQVLVNENVYSKIQDPMEEGVATFSLGNLRKLARVYLYTNSTSYDGRDPYFEPRANHLFFKVTDENVSSLMGKALIKIERIQGAFARNRAVEQKSADLVALQSVLEGYATALTDVVGPYETIEEQKKDLLEKKIPYLAILFRDSAKFPMTEILYKFILDLKHSKSPVKVLHGLVGDTYAELFTNGEEDLIDKPEKVLELDLRIAAQFVSEFIVNNLTKEMA